MTEVLRIAHEPLDSAKPHASISPSGEIPYHLRKSTLRKIQKEEGENLFQNLWNERGIIIERRVRTIISSQLHLVKEVKINERNTEEDALGHDLTVFMNGQSPIPEVYIQVKSSRFGIVEFKQAIRDKLPEGKRDMDEVRKWMTKNNIILINGSEEKSPEEILSESFYPQLERIIARANQKPVGFIEKVL